MKVPSALHAFLNRYYPGYENINLVKKGENMFQADLYNFMSTGKIFLVKSYHRRMCLSWLSRKLLLREVKFYKIFSRFTFMLPLCAVSKDSLAFVIPYISSVSLKKITPYECFEVFQKANKIVGIVHHNKVSHGDIRLNNFLYDGKALYLIDWVTAINWNNSLSRRIPMLIKRLFYHTDLQRLQKIFSFLLPAQVTFNPPWWYYPGHFLRKKIYRRFKKKSG